MSGEASCCYFYQNFKIFSLNILFFMSKSRFGTIFGKNLMGVIIQKLKSSVTFCTVIWHSFLNSKRTEATRGDLFSMSNEVSGMHLHSGGNTHTQWFRTGMQFYFSGMSENFVVRSHFTEVGFKKAYLIGFSRNDTNVYWNLLVL